MEDEKQNSFQSCVGLHSMWLKKKKKKPKILKYIALAEILEPEGSISLFSF